MVVAVVAALTQIRLERKVVERLYCRSVEAERALDAAILAEANWLGEFYDPARRDEVQNLIAACARFGGPDAGAADASVDDTLTVFVPRVGLLRRALAELTSKVRHSWIFRGPEISFITANLRALLKLVSDRPPHDRRSLISLRMRFYATQQLIRLCCGSSIMACGRPTVEQLSGFATVPQRADVQGAATSAAGVR